MTMFSLHGKTALVTGAGGLLGRHHCVALAEAGARVIAADLHLGNAQDALSELEGNHLAIFLDVSDDVNVKAIVADLWNDVGPLDILVNNAAMNDMVENPALATDMSAFENYPADLFRRVLDVNVTGMFLLCQAIAPRMANRGLGNIINIASTYGVVAPDQRIYQLPDGSQSFYKSAAYPVSKGAVIMLTQFLAAYYGAMGIRVNTLSPGGVENGQTQTFIDNYTYRTPLGRMAKPTDYKGALIFLASDASGYLTGHNLLVDGGWTTW